MLAAYVIDNGNLSFKLKFTGSNIDDAKKFEIFLQDVSVDPDQVSENIDQLFVTRPSYTGKYNKAFFGYPDYGSTVLVEQQDGSYVWADVNVIKFNTPNEDYIIDYVSKMGNNSVPYSYAVGEKYVYIGSYKIYFPKQMVDLNGDVVRQFFNWQDQRRSDIKYIMFQTYFPNSMNYIKRVPTESNFIDANLISTEIDPTFFETKAYMDMKDKLDKDKKFKDFFEYYYKSDPDNYDDSILGYLEDEAIPIYNQKTNADKIVRKLEYTELFPRQ